MAIAQRVAGFSLGQADILRRAMGKKKKSELDKQYEGFHQGMADRGFSMPPSRLSGRSCCPSPTMPSTRPTRPPTGSCRIGPPTSRRTIGRVHGGAPHERRRLEGQDGGVPERVPPDGHQGAPPDVNESTRYFSAVGHDIRFGLGAVRNVGANVVDGVVAARADAPFTSFHGFLSAVPPHVANKRTIESLIKPARSTRSATRGAPSSRSMRMRRSRPCSTSGARPTARSGSTSTACGTSPNRCRRFPSVRNGPRRTNWPSSGRCSGSTCPTTRSPVSRCRWPSTPRSRSTTSSSPRSSRRRPSHGRGPRHERPAPRREIQRQPLRHHHGRRLRWRGHGHVHGQDLPGVPAPRCSRTRSSSSAGASRGAMTGSTSTPCRRSRPTSVRSTSPAPSFS